MLDCYDSIFHCFLHHLPPSIHKQDPSLLFLKALCLPAQPQVSTEKFTPFIATSPKHIWLTSKNIRHVLSRQCTHFWSLPCRSYIQLCLISLNQYCFVLTTHDLHHTLFLALSSTCWIHFIFYTYKTDTKTLFISEINSWTRDLMGHSSP